MLIDSFNICIFFGLYTMLLNIKTAPSLFFFPCHQRLGNTGMGETGWHIPAEEGGLDIKHGGSECLGPVVSQMWRLGAMDGGGSLVECHGVRRLGVAHS